jgi:hypothetical protein
MKNDAIPYRHDPNRNNEKKDRNKEILIRVLNGETYDNIGIEHHISREKVRQIVMKYCRRTDYVKNRMGQSSVSWMELSTLREHKHQIIKEVIKF